MKNPLCSVCGGRPVLIQRNGRGDLRIIHRNYVCQRRAELLVIDEEGLFKALKGRTPTLDAMVKMGAKVSIITTPDRETPLKWPKA